MGGIPVVSNGRLRIDSVLGQQALVVGSKRWFQSLSHNSIMSFRFQGETGSYTARKEERESGEYWYAYKKIQGKLRSTYIGRTDELTLDKLESIAIKIYEPKVEQKVTQRKCVTSQDSRIDKYDDLVEIIEKWLNESEGKTSTKDRTWSYALKLLKELKEVIEDV